MKMDYNINSDDELDSYSYNNDSLNNNNSNSNDNVQMKNPNGLSKAELRRSNKPIMEKRRRARINHCLNELKSLILEAMKKDPARHTKLEKADILEMTVKHLQSIQRRQLSMAIQTDPTVIHKFKTGFVECADEVKRYIGQLDGVDTGTRQRLSNYLNNCANSLEQIGSFSNFSNGYRSQSAHNFVNTAPVPSQILPFSVPHDPNNNGRVQMGGVKLIPSLLPSGEFALIMPTANAGVLKPNTNETTPFCVPNLPTTNVDFTANFPRASAFMKPTNKIAFPAANYHDINTTSSVPPSATTTSPPLSPISSISSQEEDSIMHTSSDFASRSITPPLDTSQSSFSAEVFSTPCRADSSIHRKADTPTHLEVSSSSEGITTSKRYYSYTASDTSEQPSSKKSNLEKQENTDSNGNVGNVKKEANVEETSENMWRPW